MLITNICNKNMETLFKWNAEATLSPPSQKSGIVELKEIRLKWRVPSWFPVQRKLNLPASYRKQASIYMLELNLRLWFFLILWESDSSLQVFPLTINWHPCSCKLTTLSVCLRALSSAGGQLSQTLLFC